MQQQAQQQMPIMVGGAKMKQAILDWSKQSNQLFLTVFGAALILYAAYSEKIPILYRYQLSTTIGRLLLLVILYIVHEVAGWIPALLFAVGIALTWSNRPLFKPVEAEANTEGFQDNVKVAIAGNKKWFVEEVLEENPAGIVEDRVGTRAVQDDSEVGNSRTSR